MRLMPVSPPSVGVAVQALPAVDWPGGLAPSSAHQGSLQASLQMVLAERGLLSSPPASELASRLALRQASRLASPTQFLRLALAQVSELASRLASPTQFLRLALAQVSESASRPASPTQFLRLALAQVSRQASRPALVLASLRSSEQVLLVSVP